MAPWHWDVAAPMSSSASRWQPLRWIACRLHALCQSALGVIDSRTRMSSRTTSWRSRTSERHHQPEARNNDAYARPGHQVASCAFSVSKDVRASNVRGGTKRGGANQCHMHGAANPRLGHESISAHNHNMISEKHKRKTWITHSVRSRQPKLEF